MWYAGGMKVWQAVMVVTAIMAYVRPLWLKRGLLFVLLFCAGIGG